MHSSVDIISHYVVVENSIPFPHSPEISGLKTSCFSPIYLAF